LDSKVREWVGKVSAGIVPTEIVSPPIPWNELDALTPLIEGLRARGAKGTDEGISYSFEMAFGASIVTPRDLKIDPPKHASAISKVCFEFISFK